MIMKERHYSILHISDTIEIGLHCFVLLQPYLFKLAIVKFSI